MDILCKFRIGLKKTSSLLTSNIVHSLSSKQINPEIISEIETALISADIGLNVTEHLINKIKSAKIVGQVDLKIIIKLLSTEITKILSQCEQNIFK